MRFHNVAIEATAYELGPHRVTSKELEAQLAPTMQRLGIQAGRLEELSGIRERRFWDPGTMPSDVATSAARKVIALAGIDPGAIGCLINTSVCKDYIEPSVACLVHGNLRLRPSCLNYDISNACLGFLNGMTSAGLMIEANLIDYALIVDGEGAQQAVAATVSRLLREDLALQEFRDSFATLTLGSGAVAMVLCRKDLSHSGHRLNGAVTLAASEHNRLCIGQPDYMKTDASALLIAGVKLAAETWRIAAAELPNWSDDQIAIYIPHQVGARHVSALAETLRIGREKLHLNFPTLGNIGPAALPITLAMADEASRIKAGDHVALLGIGSGLNCSMMSVRW
jgi:3-oxoacyl-[acyl-carrier-protein] synthase-3